MKLDPAELADAFGALIRDVASTLEEHGCPWMVVGGLAVGSWTEPRGTKDCDLAVALPPDPERLEAALAAIGLRAPVPGTLPRVAEEGGGPARMQSVRAHAPPLVVDLLCAGTAFETEAIARRRPATLFEVPVYIATPDDLAVYKLIAGRPQDLADVDRLIRFGRVPEDEPRLRRWAREWEVEQTLDRLLAQARDASD